MYPKFLTRILYTMLLLLFSHSNALEYKPDGSTIWQRLGLNPKTSFADIRKQCIQLNLLYHPDRHVGQAGFEDITKSINDDCDKAKESAKDSVHQEKTEYTKTSNNNNYDDNYYNFWEESRKSEDRTRKAQEDAWKEYLKRQEAEQARQEAERAREEAEWRARKAQAEAEQRARDEAEYAQQQQRELSHTLTRIDLDSIGYNMSLRRSYVSGIQRAPDLYAVVTVLPVVMSDHGSWGSHTGGGAIINLIGGYSFLWGSYTLAVQAQPKVFSGYTYEGKKLTAPQVDTILTLGTTFGNQKSYYFNAYGFLGVPGVEIKINGQHQGIGNPFFCGGLGIDASYNFFTSHQLDLVLLANGRWMRYASRNLNFFPFPGDFHVHPGDRIDLLMALRGDISWFGFELGVAGTEWRRTHTDHPFGSGFPHNQGSAYALLRATITCVEVTIGTSFKDNYIKNIWASCSVSL